MEPNKLEKEFKQKLDQRTIQPTDMAWDRLDAMLSITEKKKKPNRTWMYMAACFLALLLAGTFFLNQQKNTELNTNSNSAVTTNNIPANAPATTVNDTSTIPAVIVHPSLKQAAVATVSAPPAKRFKKEAHAIQQPDPLQTVTPAMPQEQQQLAQAPTAPQVMPAPGKVQKIKVDAANLLASVENKGKKQQAVANTKISEPQVKVSRNALLLSVETELDDSFRGKVLNTISKNYSTVKTAVANRNLQ